jgi:hypothetical protein
VRPRLRVVGDPWKSPAQPDGSRQLTLLVEDDADCLGIGPGDEEHPKSRVARRTAGKRAVRSFHQALIKNRLTDLGKTDGTAINSQTDLGFTTSLRSEPQISLAIIPAVYQLLQSGPTSY